MTKDEHRSTVRVLSILLALSNNPDGLTLAELSQQLAAPKSSLFPIVHTMADQNFASYNEVTQKYRFVSLAFWIILMFSILRKSIRQNQSGCHLLSGNAFRHTAPALENLCYVNVQKRNWKYFSLIL